jgi:hypothetical protein
MPIWSRKWPFIDYTVSAAPQDAGVYALWVQDDIVFIGYTGAGESIRSCLLAHFNGVHGNVTEQADHYSWEIASDPKARRGEVMQTYIENHGVAPRCNQPPKP